MNGLFGVNGLLGFLVAVVLLLSVVGVFGYLAISTQKSEATNYYRLENPLEIKKSSASNAAHYQAVK